MVVSRCGMFRNPRIRAAILVAVAGALVGSPVTLRAAVPDGVPLLEPRDPVAAKQIRVQDDAIALINRARDRLYKRSRACWPRTVLAKPNPAGAVPRQETLGLVAALRRPGSDEEKSFRPAFPNASQLYTDYTRSVTATGGQRLWVGASHGYGYTAGLSAACLRVLSVDVERAGRKRSRAVRVEARRMLSEERSGSAELQKSAGSDAIWVFTRSEVGGSSGGGSMDIATFRRRGAFVAHDGGDGSTLLQGIVPDGVATIEFEYSQLAEHGALYKPTPYPSAFRASVQVQENAFALTVPRATLDARPARMIWKSASGEVIRVVTGLK